MSNVLSKKLLFFLPFLILIAGLLLRAYHPHLYPFGFDQVQIYDAASNIVKGDFTLIGPRTGPANMFTGPLIYYIAAAFRVFTDSPYIVAMTALFISAITGVALYLLSKRYVSTAFANILLVLWAFSPFLIQLDRIPWNPNLTVIASSLVFFPLLHIKKGFKFTDSLLVALGVFLGYQAHFSGLLLLPLAIASLFIFTRLKHAGTMFLCVVAFLISLLPTVYFDYRHAWTNLHGFQELIGNKERVDTYLIFPRLTQKTLIVAETFGKMFTNFNRGELILVLGLSIVFAYAVRSHTQKQERVHGLYVLIWVISLIIALSLYRESTPEYYFLLLIPVMLYVITQLLTFFQKNHRTFLCISFSLYSVLLITHVYRQNLGFQVGHQVLAVKAIESIHKKSPIQHIAYDMDSLDALGVQHTLRARGFVPTEEGAVVHIAYPDSGNALFTAKTSDNSSVWVDTRTSDEKTYLTTRQYIVSVPKEWHIYQDFNRVENLDFREKYIVLDEKFRNKGFVYVIDSMKMPELNKKAELLISSQNPVVAEFLEKQDNVFIHQKLLFITTGFESLDDLKQVEVLVH